MVEYGPLKMNILFSIYYPVLFKVQHISLVRPMDLACVPTLSVPTLLGACGGFFDP